MKLERYAPAGSQVQIMSTRVLKQLINYSHSPESSASKQKMSKQDCQKVRFENHQTLRPRNENDSKQRDTINCKFTRPKNLD